MKPLLEKISVTLLSKKHYLFHIIRNLSNTELSWNTWNQDNYIVFPSTALIEIVFERIAKSSRTLPHIPPRLSSCLSATAAISSILVQHWDPIPSNQHIRYLLIGDWGWKSISMDLISWWANALIALSFTNSNSPFNSGYRSPRFDPQSKEFDTGHQMV